MVVNAADVWSTVNPLLVLRNKVVVGSINQTVEPL